MNTTRSNRPNGAPAYYLGRSADSWQSVLPKRGPKARSHSDRAVRDATLAFYVRGGSRWN
jgi:hypothetical protein